MVSLKKSLSYSLCTVFGAGYFPFAPGTFTSVLAVVLFYLLQPQLSIFAAAIGVIFFAGLLFSKEIEKYDGKDPRHVVIDELAGQWITLFFIPHISFQIIIMGLLFFRFFDILKPFGINRIQKMKSGWGIMLDDVLAGIYSNIALQILILMDLL